MQDQTRYLARRRVQRYKSTPKHHQFPVKGDYYKTGLSFEAKAAEFKSVNIVHVVIIDIMLALA
jgi:hypothetical protein